MSVVLGIDASLTSTGWVVLNSNEKHKTGVIASSQRGVERLLEIGTEIMSLVRKEKPDLVTIEGYAYARANQAHQIGELGGVLRAAMTRANVRWVEVSPSAVKKFATGRGNAKKELIILEVYKRWGQEFKTNDQADAYVLARIGQALLAETERKGLREPEDLAKFQQEVIDGIIKNLRLTQEPING